MTDHELLAYERKHHGDPYMTLAKAKEMQCVALQFRHLGRPRRRRTGKPRRRRSVAFMRSCFGPIRLSSKRRVHASTETPHDEEAHRLPQRENPPLPN
jgi:hypothetical protein